MTHTEAPPERLQLDEYRALWPATREERNRRLDAALAAIEAAGEAWNQAHYMFVSADAMPETVWTNEEGGFTSLEPGEVAYACGTAYCLAGHVAAGAGYTHAPIDSESATVLPVRYLPLERGYSMGEAANPATGRIVDVYLYARRWLGLESGDAQLLFNAGNDLPAMRRQIARLKAAPFISRVRAGARCGCFYCCDSHA